LLTHVLAIGFAIAATTAANAQDRIYKYLSKKNDGRGEPEYRLVMTQTGMCIMPIGLFIFVSAPRHARAYGGVQSWPVLDSSVPLFAQRLIGP
jgi:DHA1 family multidrug resistance protein-like MFS transporter